MIVCSCNVLCDADLKQAYTPGIESVEQLYACLGCKPQCGRCVEYVEETLLQPCRKN